MRFKDILVSEKCVEIYTEVNEFANSYLKKYNDQIESLGFNSKPKDIFDYVWGTIELNAVEICLIDSPLIQRLRCIQQLGFASYVYCNADYSRFAHTVGVVEISGRMSKVITRNLKQKTPNANIFNMFEVVRLGAVFHDSGHMFYSHVSEKFFTENSNYKHIGRVTKTLTHFNEQISMRASFHEMLSVMIVNSDEVKRFFSLTAKHLVKSKILKDDEINLLIDYISGLIVGTAVDKSILPYSMIIKGAIDADRMDYLSRDSSTTKVPLAVDIARLVNKITVVKIDNYEPAHVWYDHTSDDYPYQSMAIQYSAQRLVWQLSMARAILYQSIYFHHKKLTAEAMFRRACEKIFKLIPERSSDFTYLMSLKDQAISEYFPYIIIPEKHHDNPDFLAARDILIRIRDRDLYKRVASFSQDSFSSAPNYLYEVFVADIIEDQFSDKCKVFVDNLTNEYYKVLNKLSRSSPTASPVFMFIEANWKNEMSDDIPIDFGNALYKMSSHVFKETPTLGEENRQKQYYLVTDQHERELVYVALERVLFMDYKMQIQDSSSTCAKFTSEQLSKVKSDLFELNYYKDSLILLPDGILNRLCDKIMFQKVVDKYHSFTGVRNCTITVNSLCLFLKQFLYAQCNKDDIRHLLNGVLRLLLEATFINREFFSKNVSSLMKQILDKGYNANYIVKLGGAFDSANRLTYYFNDVKEKGDFEFIETVPAALKLVQQTDGCIVFFDDGAYSGKQVVSIFQELMGIPIKKRETNETHTQLLDGPSKEALKSSKIILAYICFNKKSEKFILSKLCELGISNVEIVYERDLSQKVFDSVNNIFDSQTQRDVVKEKIQDIGYQVQRSSKLVNEIKYKDRWDEERVCNSALGYNDAQQMVVFEFNVPTYTLTPFWQNGRYNGSSWTGLFQRTDK